MGVAGVVKREGSMLIDRRSFLAGAAAIAASSTARGAQGTLKQEPLKIGLLMVKSGPLAAGGKHMENGLRYFLDERNSELAGRKIELVTADTAGAPPICKSKAEELIERYGVDVLIGPYTSAEALAIAGVVEQAGVPILLSSSGADDLTQRRRSPWIVRSIATSSQIGYTLGDYCAKNLKYKKVACIGLDSNYGYEIVGGFQKMLEASGGKVIQRIWTPFGTTDLAPYVSQLDPGADAFLNCLPGNDTIVCFKLLKEYGLGDGRGVLCPPGSVDETLLDGMGDEAVGAISCGWYSPTSHAPGASELEVGFRQKYKSDPGALSTGSMLAGLVLEQALIKLGGNAADKAALAKALHEVAIADSPFGSVKLDEYGNAVLTMYIRRVVRRNGRLANEAIAEVRDVDQFYKLDPRTQLALPPFGRA